MRNLLMFKEYDCFQLNKLLPEENIPLGTVGVILMKFNSTDYEVEFLTEKEET